MLVDPKIEEEKPDVVVEGAKSYVEELGYEMKEFDDFLELLVDESSRSFGNIINGIKN